MKRYVVFRALDPPCDGGRYVIASKKKEAISMVRKLNTKAVVKDWSWSEQDGRV